MAVNGLRLVAAGFFVRVRESAPQLRGLAGRGNWGVFGGSVRLVLGERLGVFFAPAGKLAGV